MTTDLALYEPGLHYGVPDEEYRQIPGLSSTGIKEMLKSPAHYQWARTHRRERIAFDVGHAAHAKILGVGLEAIPYPDEHLTPSGNVSEKAATKAWAADQRAQGLVPIAPDQLAAVDAMAEAVARHPLAGKLIGSGAGNPEVSLLWDDPDTGIRCKGRIDYLRPDGATDLKTCRSADPRRFGSPAASYGYAEQAVHYSNGVKATRGDTELEFYQVLVETDAPHFVSVVELDPTFLMLAEIRVRRAIDTYAECQRTGDWPAYPTGVNAVAAPGWYGDDDYTDEMEI
jgi:hypothetical protein